jgi:hypothetical protein
MARLPNVGGRDARGPGRRVLIQFGPLISTRSVDLSGMRSVPHRDSEWVFDDRLIELRSVMRSVPHRGSEWVFDDRLIELRSVMRSVPHRGSEWVYPAI